MNSLSGTGCLIFFFFLGGGGKASNDSTYMERLEEVLQSDNERFHPGVIYGVLFKLLLWKKEGLAKFVAYSCDNPSSYLFGAPQLWQFFSVKVPTHDPL